MNTTDRQAQVISFLRLPLVVLVLFVHSNFHGISTAWDALWVSSTNHIGPQLPTLGAIIDFLSGSLALLANPFSFSSVVYCSFGKAYSRKNCISISCNEGYFRCLFPISLEFNLPFSAFLRRRFTS